MTNLPRRRKVKKSWWIFEWKETEWVGVGDC